MAMPDFCAVVDGDGQLLVELHHVGRDVELANRVAERSPPVKSTSTASALAMFILCR